jgi:hypothetical protein
VPGPQSVSSSSGSSAGSVGNQSSVKDPVVIVGALAGVLGVALMTLAAVVVYVRRQRSKWSAHAGSQVLHSTGHHPTSSSGLGVAEAMGTWTNRQLGAATQPRLTHPYRDSPVAVALVSGVLSNSSLPDIADGPGMTIVHAGPGDEVSLMEPQFTASSGMGLPVGGRMARSRSGGQCQAGSEQLPFVWPGRPYDDREVDSQATITFSDHRHA